MCIRDRNDVLIKIESPLFVNIELKGSDTAGATSKIIADFSRRTSWSWDNFIVSSFNWDELKKFRSIDNNTPVGVLVSKSISINEAIEFGKKINAQAIILKNLLNISIPYKNSKFNIQTSK